MSDLISRQSAIDTLAEMYCKSDEDGYVWIIRGDAWKRIDALPAVQSERRKGRWIDDCACSECHWIHEDDDGFPLITKYNFCPSCGARMEVQHDNTQK